jgi:hypothetical protein
MLGRKRDTVQPRDRTGELLAALADQQAAIGDLVKIIDLFGEHLLELRAEVRELRAIAEQRQVIRLRLGGGRDVDTKA